MGPERERGPEDLEPVDGPGFLQRRQASRRAEPRVYLQNGSGTLPEFLRNSLIHSDVKLVVHITLLKIPEIARRMIM